MSDGFLVRPGVAPIIVAVLVKRLGGEVIIDQSELDAVAFCRLNEETNNHSMRLTLDERKNDEH